jgi:hypothetical protein
MCFVNTDLCHLQHKLIGFIIEMKSVYSAVRTGALNEAVCAPSLKGWFSVFKRLNHDILYSHNFKIIIDYLPGIAALVTATPLRKLLSTANGIGLFSADTLYNSSLFLYVCLVTCFNH